MGDVWLDLTSSLLRPERPGLARCLRERDRHLAERKQAAEARTRSIADCERRIELARAAIFAASDGVVGAKMTDLEREWRLLAKVDPDAGVMNLWSRIAPTEWHDRKLWRECPAVDRVDLAVALASDVDGVKNAERAAIAFRDARAGQGITMGARISWRFVDHDRAVFVTTFREPPPQIRDDVRDAVLARFSDRPLLARDVGHVATQPKSAAVEAVRAIWRTGYGIQAFDGDGITLVMPPL